MIKKFLNKVSRFNFKLKWENEHPGIYINVLYYTQKKGDFCKKNIKIGKKTYGELIIQTHMNEMEGLNIGNFCSIAGNVLFILGGGHDYKNVSSYPFGEKYKDKNALTKGKIIIDDDVWIGQNSIILSGVHIGQGAIIGAGSVVTKDVPPYAIVGGNPATIIKYRFDDDLIKELVKIDYSKITDDDVKLNLDKLCKNIKDKDDFKWMIK